MIVKLQRATPFDLAMPPFATKRHVISFSGTVLSEKAPEQEKGAGQETLQGIADKIVGDLIKQELTFRDTLAVIEMMQDLLEYIQGRHRAKLDTTPIKELMMARKERKNEAGRSTGL